MSSRAMRKLHNEPEIFLGDEAVDDELDDDGDDNEGEVAGTEESGSKTNTSKKKKKKKNKVVNPFELLNEIDDGPSDSEEIAPSESPEDQNRSKKDTECLQNGTEMGNHTAADEKTKKKKKKKKKKQKGGSSGTAEGAEEDEIDVSIREVNELLKSNPRLPYDTASTSSSGAKATHAKPLLAVEHKHLNPENELRRIFGSNVIKNELRQRGRNRQYQKSTWLVTPKQSWPKMTKTGLSMSHVATEGRYHTFEYEHSRDYQTVQFEFLDAVQSMNPANIMAVMNAHPYHIDSLLQLSEVSRMNEDMGMALDLIERALYSFECAFHTLFSIAEGTCQLNYRRAENRGLFLALFKHLSYLGQKGCNRTALEFCKLLLGLEPDSDPLGVLLMIDYYALKTDQYEFLIRMFAEWEAHRNLSQLPNWAFSIAMAHLHNNPSSSAAAADQPSTRKADSLLQDALLMFPSVLLPLLEKCSIQPDGATASHSFFSRHTQSGSEEALSQLVDLFVARNYSFWKESENMRWLEKNAEEVIKRVDAGDSKVKDYAEKRESRYIGTPRNVYRHIFLSDHLGIKLKLPPALANTPLLSYDPLPPPDSEFTYSRPLNQLRPVRRGGGGIFAEFLRSIVPSYIPPSPGEMVDEPDDDDDLGAAGGYLNQNSNLRQGVGAVMEAMRQLLQTLDPLQRPDEGDDDNEEQLEEID